MLSRDQVLALMRERVHHPAAMRELLQVLKIPRDDRTSFKRHIKNLVASDRRMLMDIFVPPGQEGGASPGDMVVVELTRWPTSGRGAIGRVAEVLGDIDAPGVDTEIIIRKWGIPDAHSNDAVTEAVRLGGSVSERDLRGR